MKKVISTIFLIVIALTFVASQSLKLDVIGDGKIEGRLSLEDQNGNLFVGQLAGANSQSPGNNNVGIGYKALQINGNNTNNDFTADNNVAIGYESLSLNQNGDDNVAIGFQSMIANIMGSKNVAIGKSTFTSNTQGDDNVAIGFKALESSTMGGNNIAIGSDAMASLIDDYDNITIGGGAASSLGAGFSNVVMGNRAFGEAQNGSENVIIGSNAAINFSNSSANLSRNICIGANSAFRYTTMTLPAFPLVPINQIVIGEGATSVGNNTVVLGNSDVHTVYMNEDGTANVISSSDVRMKRDIAASDMGLDFILGLRAVSYNWKPRAEFPSVFIGHNQKKESLLKEKGDVQHGFIAQEVKALLDKNNIDWQGWTALENNGRQGLSYSAFVVPLTKAIQEQQDEISELEAEIQSLQSIIESILSK